MKHIKTTAFLIIVSLAAYGALHLKFQSPIIERQAETNNPLDNLILSKNIDDNQIFWAKLGDDK